jgi:hypothetical protein
VVPIRAASGLHEPRPLGTVDSGLSINGFLIPLGLAWFAEAMLQRRRLRRVARTRRGTERRQ